MESSLGLLRIRVKRGINLAIRDTLSSDPYVVVTMGDQKLKTRVVKKNCNPEWNDELTLSITNLETPITLTVFDRDTITLDDKMGDTEIDIKPYVECLQMKLESLADGCAVKRIHPSRENCLAEESSCVWNNGKIVQDMCLRLRNVECGEIVIQIEWINHSGCKSLLGEEAKDSSSEVEAKNDPLEEEAKNDPLEKEATKGLLEVANQRGLLGVEATN